jgi:hypothetical protein
MAEEKPPAKWSRMDLREFHKSGLLWQVNQSILWPLGLALAIQVEADGSVSELFVQRLDPADAIVDGATSEEREDKAERLLAWTRERLGG